MANIFTDQFAGSGLISTAVFENFPPVSGAPGNEIAFVMGNLPDLQTLIGGIKPGVEIHILDPLGDGIAQMDSILNGRSGIDSIHVFSHGASGSLSLGTTTLNSNTLLDHQSQLAELGSHLTSTGDLLLYGCNVAQGADGHAFIESIARTTGADVSASTNLTGSSALGGDWVLDANAGSIERQNLTIDSFASVLSLEGSATIQQGTDTSLIRYDLHNWFNSSAFAFQVTLVPIYSPDTGSTGADIVFQAKNPTGLQGITVGNWYTFTELSGAFSNGQATDNGVIDANSSQGYMDFAIAARIDWNNPNLPAMLEFTLGGSRTYQLAISKAAPPNTAPSAGSGSYTIYEGQSATVTLSTSTTSARDPENDALTFNPTSVSYTAPTNAAQKGTYNNVSSSSYSVSDGNLSGTGGVFSWNVTYADDPTTWGTPPANQTWSSSGTSSFSYGTGASDPEGDAITYSYVSGKQTWMSISGTTISSNVAPEYAGHTYTITASATSSGTPSPIQKTFTITTGTAEQLNDIPTAAANSLALSAVGTRTFTAANFGFTDLDNTVGLSTATGAALDHITITALPATGTLKLSDTAVTLNQQILAANIANLTYTSATTFDKNDTFTFTVNDGIADSAGSYTVTLTDTLAAGQAPVIKLPSVTGSTLLIPYTDASYLNSAKAPATTDYVVTVNGSAVTVSGVAIASNSRTVTLTLAVPVAVTDHITISYTKPASNAVQDSSGNEAAGFSARDIVNGTVSYPETGPTVITTQSSYDTSIPAPTGDVDVVNTGSGTVIINALDPNGTVVTSGTGATTVKDPTGSVNTTNTGTGATTVDGAVASSVVTATGTGITNVSNPANNVQVVNNSTGSILITGVSSGNTVIPKGSGEVVVTSVLTTPGTITVDATNKQSNLTADNDSTGTINITGLATGASLTSTGSGNNSGATNIVTPVGNLTLNNSGTSPVNITGFDNAATLTVTGSGSTNVTSPDGHLTVVNNGAGTATISGTLDGKTVTPQGTGPVVVTSLLGAGSSITVAATGNQSNVTADNDGLGVIIITGLTEGASLKSTGSGTGATNVVTPIGSLALNNTGTSPVNITGIDTGKTLTITGGGSTNIVNPDGNVTVNNAGTGTATVSGTTNSSTITTQGTGPITVNSVLTGTDGIIVNAAANQYITLDNDGTGTITVGGVTTGSTIYNIGSGSGTTNISNPTGTGTLTVQNTGTDPLSVTGLDTGATLTNTASSNGSGGIILASPDGNASINNLGSNTVTATGVATDAIISTVGTGTITISDPTANLTVNNTGTGTVSVNGLNNDAAITTNGNHPITISSPDGSLTVYNTGTGIDTVTGLLNNKAVNTDGTGTTIVSDPSGNATLHNTGSGSLSVTGANNGSTVTTTGTTDTTVTNPDGNVTVKNTGTGTTTVTGTLTTKTVAIDGTGAIVVNSMLLSPGIITVDATLNQQHLTVDNDGTGAINITGLTNGASLKSTGDGTGTTTVLTPIGDLALESTGTNVVVITGFDTGRKLSVTGTANTTVRNPDGDVTVDNTGTGIVTVEGAPDGKTVTTSGSGTTVVSDPLGDITLHNDNLNGVVSVSGVNTGKTVNSTGVGPKEVNAPDGDITINSTGTGVTTVSGTLNGKSVTTRGTGPITIHSELTAGNTINVNAAANTHITLDNDDTGAINVTGVTTGSTITSTGTGGADKSGTTTIANPTGNLNVDNIGTSPVKITGFDTNKILTVTGNATSSTEVVNPDGNVFVSNNGDGQLTVSGVNNGNSVTNSGAGPLTITHPDSNVNTINLGTGLISVNNVHNGSTVNCTGNGPQTIDLASLTATQSATVDNDGTGAVNVTNIPSGVAVTFTGDGPTTVSSLTGNVTLENIVNLSPSLVTIANAANGSIITTIGDGPFFMDADVPASQSVTVDISNNANITFDNDGSGVVNVIGSNNNTITTTGNGPMTVTNPLGNLVVDNSGSGVVTVNGAANNAIITPQHEGPVVVNSQLAAGNSISVDATGNQSHLTVDNDGTGIIYVTNLAEGASLTSIGIGSGATNVVTPVGNLSLDNTGTSPVNITGFDTGKTLTIAGSGSTNITSPDGDLKVVNNGVGTATVSGALDGKTVTPEGSGPVVVSSSLIAGSSITVDATGNQSHVTADNDGTGVINVTGLSDGATLKSTGSGSGATNVVTPVGNLTLENSGSSPVNITGFDNSKTLAVTGSGQTTVSSPDGDMTVANNGSGLVTLTGVLENKTISATGSGNTAISTPNGDIAVVNSGSGLVTLSGILDGKIVTTSGTGPATIDNPAGNVTVANSGTGLVKVNGANDNSTVTTTGDQPVTISSPDGNLTVHNIGTGVDTVTGLLSGKTVTTDGSGETIVSDPSGDVTLHNTGIGVLSVTGANNGSTVTATGSQPTTVSNSDGNVTVKNTGTGTTTVNGMHTGSVVTLDGNGPIIVHSDLLTPDSIGVNATLNQNNLTVDNDGTGAINITGLTNGASIKSTGSGTGTTTVSDPTGSISLNNTGTNIVTITGFDNDQALTVTGSGPTTVSSPDGNASIINNGTGLVTLTGVGIGKTISTSGSGQTNVSDPLGNITLDNASLTGTVAASGVNIGCTVTTTGVGLKEVNAPDGNVTINSTGTGKTTVSGTLSGSTVTTQGTGPITVHSDLTTGTVNVNAALNRNLTLDNDYGGAINVTGVTTGSTIHNTGSGSGNVTINSPVGSLTIDNTGIDPVKITGFDTNKTLTLTGSATSSTEVVDPDGNVVVANSSSAALTISGLNIGSSVTNKAGSGAVNITNPDGNVYATNDGTGAITISGLTDGSTINSKGSGPQTVDLANLGSGHSVTIDNDGSGLVNLLHVSDGTTVSFTGNTLTPGSTTISSLSGEVTLENVSASSSVISVSGIANGSKIHTTGTGKIAITTTLSAGEKISIDPTGNDHLRITNTGAGQVDLLGSIALDSNDGMAFTLTGNNTTIVNETGTLDLGSAPLTLSLATGYTPQAGDSITLISNDGSDAVTGIFAGKAEGSVVMVGGYQFTISYHGGDGNDVVLGMSRPPVVDTTDVTGSVAEQGTPSGNITDSGTIGFTDGDTADTHTVSAVTPSSGALGTLTAIRTTDSTGTGLGGLVTWNYSVAASAVEYLAAGEQKIESFTFSVQDSQGNSVSRTVDVTIMGTNDAPTLGSVTNGSIAEDTLASTTTDSGLSDTLAGADVDNNNTLTYGITGGTVASGLSTLHLTYGTLTVNTSTGAYSYAKDSAAVEALHVGESVSDVFTVTVTDDQNVATTQSYSVNLTGANDAPTLAAVTSGSIAEDALASTTSDSGVSGTLAGADVDNNHTLTYGITGGTVTSGLSTLHLTYGTLTVNTSTGAYSYAKDAAAVEALKEGETASDLFTVTVTDDHNVTTAQNYTVNLTGANDAPTLVGVTAGSIAENALASTTTDSGLSGTLAGADVDNNHTLTYGITGGTVVGTSSTLHLTYGTLTVNTLTGAYSYAKDAAAVEKLHVGESVSDVFTMTVTDEHNIATTKSYTINLTGANDAPTLAAVTSGSIAENALASTTTDSGLSGTLAGADVDNNHTLTYGITGGAVAAGSSTLHLTYGTLTVNTSTGAYSYAKDAAAVEALKEGDTASDVFTLTVTDDHNVATTQSYTINLTGANDAPTLAAVTSGSIAEDALASTTTDSGLSGTLAGADVDNNHTLTYGITGGTVASGSSTLHLTYGTLTVNTSTGAYSYAKDAAAVEALHPGESVSDVFTVTVTDDHNVATTQSYTINLTGANDAPTLAAVTSGSIAEDALASTTTNSGLSGTLVGADIDNDKVLTYGITGGTVASGSSTLHLTYGTLTVNTSTGAYSYAKDAAAVEALHVGESVSDVFTVSVTDNHGAQATRSYTINLSGANDAPIINSNSSLVSGSMTEAGHLDNGQAVLNGMGLDGLTHITDTLSASDVDNNATKTWSISDQTPSTVYGTMTINTSTGKWDYGLNNYLPATQALREGDVVTETFTARVTDDQGAYADQTVTITISGTNDVPVVANNASALDGIVTEAGNLDNGTVVSGTSTASATLSASDVDTGATQTWSLVGKPVSTYGVMSIDSATGKWTYTLDNTLAATQALKEGDVETQTYTARVTDDKEAYVNQTITITINGTNDSPVVVADTNNTSENAALTVTAANGLLANDTDPDTGATQAVSAVNGLTGKVGTAVSGNHGGSFTIATDGSYTFNPGSSFDYLAVGETATTSASYTVIDDKGATSSSTVTVTLTGTNDAAMITGTSTASLTETDEVLTATGRLSVTDVDNSTTFAAQTDVAGNHGYGKFSITTAGVWSYTTNTAHNEFIKATNYTDSFTVATADGTEQVVTVTIAGTNDAPVISGTLTGSITETTGTPTAHSTLTSSGTITYSDVDVADTHTLGAVTASTGALGTLTITKTSDTTGTGLGGELAWSYSVDAGAVEYLAAGETKDEIFTFTLSDDQGGTTERRVTVTLAGTNDAVAIVSGSTIASGAFTEAPGNTGSAALDRVSSSIAFADADLSDAHGITVTGTSFEWSNGTLTQAQQETLAAAIHLGTKVDSSGAGSGTQAWFFSAPDATFDFLAKNETLMAIYTVTFDDGQGSTASKDVVITVTGTNDAAVITGTNTPSRTETNTALTATGALSVTDVDGTATFVAQTNVAGNHGYGKFSISADGVWHYTADSAHKEFIGGTNYTDSITVAAADGTQQIITVTIAGINDAAVITGTSTASLTEAKTALAVTGTLSATDVDSAATFVAQTNVAGSNGYGHFSVGTNGVWNYTTDSAHGEFVTGTNYSDSFTVTTADGTPQLVTVTIAGSNSGAVVTGTSTASPTETNAVLTTTGTLVATDLDSPATFVARTNVAGNHGYGHFTIGTNGVWSYTTDNPHNEFASGTDYTDSFTVSTADGTEQVVTVTIAGTNDAAVVGGTSTVILTQTIVPLTVTGTLSATDVDSATTFVAQTDVAGNHGYGKFSIGTDGVWNYTANSAHSEFVGGADYTDSFTVATADGTEQLVTVTITGIDDPAVLSSVTSTLPETSILRSTGGTLTIHDDDTPSPVFVAQAGTHGNNGTFVLDTHGVWSYTFDPGLEFTAGTTYSDVFTVLSADGAATTVSVYKTGGAISLGNDSTGAALVDVSVPVGIGFSEAHSTESTLGTLRQQLIDASAPKVSDTAVFNDIRDTGIDAYVPTVVDQQQVTVRTITFSKDAVDTVASIVPITISGAQGTGEGSMTNPNRQEALVVDATNLPSGTVLNFNNVEFAIVIGAVQLTGGTGKNFVIGDSASQWIVLGEGDDTLYGGGGNDTIGSHGGNDLLYGDAGDDIVSGGDGNDTLVGGSGNDTLYGGDYIGGIVDTGNGIDTALYTDAHAGVTVNLLTGTATSSDGGDAAGIGNDTLYDIENIVGGAYSDIIIGSNADNKLEGGAGDDTLTGGKGNDTVDGGTGKDTAVFSGTMADYSISYDAATHNWTIVDTIAGRDGRDTVTNVERFQFADAFQFQGGSGDETMTGGAGIDTVTYLTALAGITVDLGTGSATSSSGGNSGIGNDTLISIENVIGGDFADTIIGSSADNQLSGGKGNDTLDGGSGTDTAVFSGNYADYTIRYDGTTHAYTIADKTADRDGTDTVINTEKFHFADGYGFTGGPGDETITGSTGHDTIMYLSALAGITVDLLHGTATTTAGGDAAGIGTDSLASIENVIGGDFNDMLIGNSSDNRLEGGKGNDTLLGGGGNDTAVFSGNLADYNVSYNAATDTYTITDKIAGRDGTDTVTNVHNFQFADGTHQDILKPTVGTFSPGSGATGVGVGNDIVLTFSEAIHPGSGTIAIHSGSPTGPVVASSADAASATVTASGSTLTINPTHDLAYNTHYYVTLADGSIHDLAENSYAGTTTYDFTTGADPYAGGSHGGNSTGVELLGLGALGVLAWAIF